MRARRTTAASVALALAIAFGIGAGPGSPAQAQTIPAPGSVDGVAVTGVGTVLATPDVLRLSLRVVIVRPDVNTALTDANAVTARIRAGLRARGVAAGDLETTQLQISPSQAGKPSRVVGYQVVQGLSAQLRDVNKAGAAVTETIRLGGTSIRFDGVFFSLSDNTAQKVQARDLAFAQAKAKAEQLARLTGRTLGGVRSVEEDLSPFPYYDSSDQFATSARAGGVPFSPGTQRVNVRVIVRWTLQ